MRFVDFYIFPTDLVICHCRYLSLPNLVSKKNHMRLVVGPNGDFLHFGKPGKPGEPGKP